MTCAGDFFYLLMGALGFVTVLVTAYLFLRPAKPQGRLDGNDAARIRALLDRHGESDSLGYFALRNDKSVIWSPTRKSCIGYRVLSGVMLASGDPLGDREAWPGAIQAFLDMAARHAWVPAVVGCSEQGAEIWCRSGDLTALELGDEAVVNVADFSLQGRSMRNVRQMVTRVVPGRLRRRGPPGRRRAGRRDRQAGQAGRLLAGQPDRARLLDGARPDRRSGRRAVRDRDGRPRTACSGRCCTSCPGATTGSRST